MTTPVYAGGLLVSPEQATLYGRFRTRLHARSLGHEEEGTDVLGDLHREILDNPESELRPAVWNLLWETHTAAPPDLMADALLLFLTERPSYEVTVQGALREMARLPLPGLQHFQAALPGHSTGLSQKQSRAMLLALQLLNDIEALEAKASTGDVGAWVTRWIRQVQGGFESSPYAVNSNHLHRETMTFEVLRRLLALVPQEHFDPALEHGGDRLSFLRRWHSNLQASLTPFIEHELPADIRRAIQQCFVVEEVYPLARMNDPRAVFERAVHADLLAEQAQGRLDPAALAGLRRTANERYIAPQALAWVHAVQWPPLNPGEAWSDGFLKRLGQLSETQQQPWPALVAFARTATAGKPSNKWLKDARKHVDTVGAATLRDLLLTTLPLLSKPRTVLFHEGVVFTGDPNLMLDEFNAVTLKGLLWMAPLVADAKLARVVADVVDSALKKVAGVGPRAPKVAHAAVYALSQMQSDAALSALARLSTSVTFKGTLKEVHKGLEVVATRLNTSPEDLLELGVPTLGMAQVGERLETWGDVDVRFTVDALGTHLGFSKGGKALKSVPASVKKDFAEELKAAQKEAEKMVAAVSQRLDSLMISGKTWRGGTLPEPPADGNGSAALDLAGRRRTRAVA